MVKFLIDREVVHGLVEHAVESNLDVDGGGGGKREETLQQSCTRI